MSWEIQVEVILKAVASGNAAHRPRSVSASVMFMNADEGKL